MVTSGAWAGPDGAGVQIDAAAGAGAEIDAAAGADEGVRTAAAVIPITRMAQSVTPTQTVPRRCSERRRNTLTHPAHTSGTREGTNLWARVSATASSVE